MTCVAQDVVHLYGLYTCLYTCLAARNSLEMTRAINGIRRDWLLHLPERASLLSQTMVLAPALTQKCLTTRLVETFPMLPSDPSQLYFVGNAARRLRGDETKAQNICAPPADRPR